MGVEEVSMVGAGCEWRNWRKVGRLESGRRWSCNGKVLGRGLGLEDIR